MPYRYSPPKPARVADLRQAADDAAVEAPPADNVDEAPEAVQEVLEKSVEPKPRKRRTRKAPA